MKTFEFGRASRQRIYSDADWEKLNEARRKLPRPTHDELLADEESLALHFDSVSGYDSKSWKARELACRCASSVVALSHPSEGLFCSGTFIDREGSILTSASILGSSGAENISGLMIDVLLADRQKVSGSVLYVDEYHNIAVIRVAGNFLKVTPLVLDGMPISIGQGVVAVARHYQTYKLMASVGEVNVRRDSLDSDDVLSSSVQVSKCGLGGPLVEMSSGHVIGMTIPGAENCTFMPSSLLLRCLKHLEKYGKVVRPWLGLKTRAINELQMDELETVSLKLGGCNGVFVRKVIKGSPADNAGLSAGDIILRCQGAQINSPVEFADALFKHAEMNASTMFKGDITNEDSSKRKATDIKVYILSKSTGSIERKSILVESFSPLEKNKWPVS